MRVVNCRNSSRGVLVCANQLPLLFDDVHGSTELDGTLAANGSDSIDASILVKCAMGKLVALASLNGLDDIRDHFRAHPVVLVTCQVLSPEVCAATIDDRQRCSTEDFLCQLEVTRSCPRTCCSSSGSVVGCGKSPAAATAWSLAAGGGSGSMTGLDSDGNRATSKAGRSRPASDLGGARCGLWPGRPRARRRGREAARCPASAGRRDCRAAFWARRDGALPLRTPQGTLGERPGVEQRDLRRCLAIVRS